MHYFTFLLILTASSVFAETVHISSNLRVTPGAINQVHVFDNIAVYAGEEDRVLLLTHARRDVVGAPKNKKIFAARDAHRLYEDPDVFWDAFNRRRYHDSSQQSTKWPAEKVPVTDWLTQGVAKIEGKTVTIVQTPGFTRNAVSYIFNVDGNKVAFVGDLIYGDGQLFDLYSLQEAIKEANIGGYHGYGGRLGDLVASLKRLDDLKLDLWIPSRGPVIRDPEAAVRKLIGRVQALYKNYLSTNALHWYFKEERMRAAGERVLGTGAEIELMPYCLHVDVPDWIWQQGTSRLLISESGHGFLLDCGNQRIIDAVQKLVDQGVLKQVDGIFATHYHNDHTDMIEAFSKQFDCPVYCTPEYAEVLAHPDRFHLPCLTDNRITRLKPVPVGTVMNWQELTFTFYYYPGQTLYHGGLLVKHPEHDPVFFIGDTFAPSGIDDYCVLNRNLLHEDSGYLLCMNILRTLDARTWLVNQHIPHLFRYSHQELEYLETRYRERISLQQDLFPWDDPNYGVDEQWAVLVPRGTTSMPGAVQTFELRLTNHSPIERTFKISPKGWRGAEVMSFEPSISLPPRGQGRLKITVKAPATEGTSVLTAGIHSGDIQVNDWADAVITVKD